MSDLTIVDNSTLTAVASCDTMAALRYVLGLTVDEDRGPLRAGHLAHSILADYLRGKSIPDIVQTADVLEYLEWATEAIPDKDRLSTPNVLRIMSRWMETHPVAGLPFQIDAGLIEVGFSAPLTEDILFVGRMDGLVRDANGVWYILEHKTTGRLDETWRRRYKTSAQITGYVWGAQQYLNQPVAGCFVNGIEFSKLPTDTKKCRTHGVPYTECGSQHAKFEMLIEHRAPHQLESWKRDAIKLARKFKALKAMVSDLSDLEKQSIAQTGQLTGACMYCQFADFCAVGRPVAIGQSLMRYEPWSPFDHALTP